MKFYEQNKRSLIKSLTFRLFILTIDFFVISIITKRYEIALTLILISSLTHTVLYFIHERLWNGIHWGKEHKINNR